VKSTINIGILGLGVVGCGAYRILRDNARAIELKAGSKLTVKQIADIDLDRPRPVDFDRSIAVRDAYEVINNPEIDIVVELIGGVHPSYDYLMAAIRNGKHVVTANKELIAKEGHSLLAEAGNRKQDFLFEASVASGIPIIRPMKTCLAGDEILEIKGILNGTTNYILSQMTRAGTDFDEALADAQARGYAERDPTDDVDGHDAAYKIAILASIGFTSRVDVSQVYREGIRRITQKDIVFARELGYTIKLLAMAKQVNGAMQIRVHPTLIPSSHPLVSVADVYNGVYLKADPVGNLMFYGRGAGPEAAGSAVVGDIIDIARNIDFAATGRIACTCFDEKPLQTMDDLCCRHYLRMRTDDRPGSLAAVANVFGQNNVSLASVLAKSIHEDGSAEDVWLTHEAPEPSVRKSLDELRSLHVVREISNWIRVEE